MLDGCTDETDRAARDAARALGLELTLIEGPAAGAGAARRAGMDAAASRLLELGRDHGLIACTDADSRPAPDWLARQLDHLADGAVAIAGLIELDDEDTARARRSCGGDSATPKHDWPRVRERDPDAGHHHFAGASLAVTAAVYREVGGLEPLRVARGRGVRGAPARARDPDHARGRRSRADLRSPERKGRRAASRSTSRSRRGPSAAATTPLTSPSLVCSRPRARAR